jgi:hypothetical protein
MNGACHPLFRSIIVRAQALPTCAKRMAMQKCYSAANLEGRIKRALEIARAKGGIAMYISISSCR